MTLPKRALDPPDVEALPDGVHRVYRVSPSWRVGMSLLGIGSLTAGYFAVRFVSRADRFSNWETTLWSVLFSAFFGFIGVYAPLWAARARLILGEHEIESRGVVRTSKLRREDIEGYRIVSEPNVPVEILLVARPGFGRDIRVSSSMALDFMVMIWVEQFEAIDDRDRKIQLEELARDLGLEKTPEERRKKLAGATTAANLLNFIACGAGFWGLLLPHWHAAAMIVLNAMIPPLVLLLAVYFSGLFRFEEDKKEERPGLAVAAALPGLVLLVRGMFDVAFLDIPRLVAFGLIVGIVAGAIAKSADPRMRGVGPVLLIFACSSLYGIGGVMQVNTRLDLSKPAVYEAPVVGKYLSGGRHTSYHLTLPPFGPANEFQDVTVEKDFYDSLRLNDRVCAYLHPGKLGVRWYSVGRCSGR